METPKERDIEKNATRVAEQLVLVDYVIANPPLLTARPCHLIR
jgi:hypothetical protein